MRNGWWKSPSGMWWPLPVHLSLFNFSLSLSLPSPPSPLFSSIPPLLQDVPILTLDCNPEFESDKEQTKCLIKEVSYIITQMHQCVENNTMSYFCFVETGFRFPLSWVPSWPWPSWREPSQQCLSSSSVLGSKWLNAMHPSLSMVG